MVGRKMNPTLCLYFNYVAAAIMSDLIIKQVLTISNGHVGISFSSLIGCIATTIAIKSTKLFLPSVL
ncbi:hypothetical protein [Maledivibacter halophilus]|uniref:hypothetical protein n=1 Tax=Maledivibacter halophilus TaxID=36842 RepID=UPI0009A67759